MATLHLTRPDAKDESSVLARFPKIRGRRWALCETQPDADGTRRVEGVLSSSPYARFVAARDGFTVVPIDAATATRLIRGGVPYDPVTTGGIARMAGANRQTVHRACEKLIREAFGNRIIADDSSPEAAMT